MINLKFVRNVNLQVVEGIENDEPNYSEELFVAGTICNDCHILDENHTNETFDLQFSDGTVCFSVPMNSVEEVKELVNIS